MKKIKLPISFKFNLKKSVSIILTLALVIILIITLLALRQKQDIRKRAAGSGVVSLNISLTPSGNLTLGNTYTARLYLINTGTVSKNIYTAGIVATFDQSVFTISPTSVTCDQGNYPLGIINTTTSSTLALTCSKRGGEVPVVLYPSGQIGSEATLGTFQLTVNSTTKTTSSITVTNFVVPDAATALDLAKMPVSFSYVINQGITPAVPTSTPIRTPTPTTAVLPTATGVPVPTATKTPVSTATPTPRSPTVTSTPIKVPTLVPSPTPTTAPGGTVLSETRGDTWLTVNAGSYTTSCGTIAGYTKATLPAQKVSKINLYLKWTSGGGNVTIALQKDGTSVNTLEKTAYLSSTAGEGWVTFDSTASPVGVVNGVYRLYAKKSGTATVQWKSKKVGTGVCDFARNYQFYLTP